jgi:hypothetical protein
MVRLDSLRRIALTVSCLAGLAATPARAQQSPPPSAPTGRVTQPAPPPSSAASLEATLRSLSLDPLCEAQSTTTIRCEARATLPGSDDTILLRVIASSETRTIFLSVPDLAHAASDAPGTPALLRRLAELNWELLLGKLEWNAASGEVRLTMVLPTHGGLDRDALGAMVRALVATAGRLGPALRALAPR